MSSTPSHQSVQQPIPPTQPSKNLSTKLCFNLLSSSFDPHLALSNLSEVSIPVKSVQALPKLSNARHLLPQSDPNYQDISLSATKTPVKSGAKSNRLDIFMLQHHHQLQTQITSSTESTRDESLRRHLASNNRIHTNDAFSLSKSVRDILVHATRFSVAERFGRNVFIRPQYPKNYPLLIMKPTTSRSLNALIRFSLRKRLMTALHQQKDILGINRRENNRKNQHGLTDDSDVEFELIEDKSHRKRLCNNSRQPNIHISGGRQYIWHSSPQVTQHILDTMSTTGVGRDWIEYFLVQHHPCDRTSSESANQIKNSQKSPSINNIIPKKFELFTQSPLHQSQNQQQPYIVMYNNAPIKYPHLTPKQLYYMLIGTHYRRKCKVHQTRRRRMHLPCICTPHLIYSYPHVNASSQKSDIAQTITEKLSNPVNSTLNRALMNDAFKYNPKNDQNTKKKYEKDVNGNHVCYYLPGPQSLLTESMQQVVQVSLIGDLPTLPTPIILTNYNKNLQASKLAHIINDISLDINPAAYSIPYNIAMTLHAGLSLGDDSDYHGDNIFPYSLFYNRSGNGGETSLSSFSRGRMKRGVGSVVVGTLTSHDRKMNITLSNCTEYRWIFVPFSHYIDVTDNSLDDFDDKDNIKNDNPIETKKKAKKKRNPIQSCGVWTILTRRVPTFVILGQSIITISNCEKKYKL